MKVIYFEKNDEKLGNPKTGKIDEADLIPTIVGEFEEIQLNKVLKVSKDSQNGLGTMIYIKTIEKELRIAIYRIKLGNSLVIINRIATEKLFLRLKSMIP